MSSTAGLESPKEEPPSLELTPSTPPSVQTDLPGGNTPPASGTTTPRASTSDSNPKKSFLAFSPLTGFLRSRYPSVAATVKQTNENGDASSHLQNAEIAIEGGEDEEDRQTIRGVVMVTNEEEEAKEVVNGHGSVRADGRLQREKLTDDTVSITTLVDLSP
jgi:hypothetical protein